MKALPRPLLMMVTPCAADLAQRVAAAIAGGVEAVQLRDRAAPPDRLAAAAAELASACRGRALLVINGDAALATACGADGVHWPESAPGTAFDGLIGRSVHSVDAAEAAEADYLVAGSIWPTASHPGGRAGGLELLAAIVAAVDTPVLAIGGVTPARAAQCVAVGAAGVAVLSPLQTASDPQALAAAYMEAMRA